MRVVQTVFGTFHHFTLAHQLETRGHLEAIFSTFPWRRLRQEGLPHARVRTFPWFHTAQYLLSRSMPRLTTIPRALAYANTLQFDRWSAGQVRALQRTGVQLDALVGISGSSLTAGGLAQQAGGVFVCDRGSTHQRFQSRIIAEEYRAWGLPAPWEDERLIAREEAIYAAADAITVPSSAAVASFIGMGISAEKVHQIPYGVDLSRFTSTGTPPKDALHCLFAGTVSLRKGVPYLLEAFAKVRHPHKKLTVAGPLQPEMQGLLSRFSLQDVEFLGAVSQARLIDLMSRSHALVLPSIEEGLALVQAQAMACGCPVIASRNSGSEDLFTDGVEGFIVDIRDSTALADRLQRLADDPPLQQAMAVAAVQRVKAVGGWSGYGDAWEALLLRLTRSPAKESQL